MSFTPTPARYADPQAVKRIAGKAENDEGAADVIAQLTDDATALVKHATGREWCIATGENVEPVTQQYDAPYSTILPVAEQSDVTGVVVTVGATALTEGTDYLWLSRTLPGGERTYYALIRVGAAWAQDALDAERPLWGDVEVSNITHPATTDTPPGPIVQATIRVAVALYKQRAAVYQHISTGTEDIGVVPPPDGVLPADTERVLGPYIRPDRPLGRP